jgi:predicted RND superfamily exporter protein
MRKDEEKPGSKTSKDQTAASSNGTCLLRVYSFLSLVLIGLGVAFGVPVLPDLLSKPSTGAYMAPKDSPSVKAKDRLLLRFPMLARMSSHEVIMVIKSVDGKSVLRPEVAVFAKNVSAKCEKDDRTSLLQPIVVGYFLGSPFLGIGKEDSTLKEGFVSDDEKAALLLFMPSTGPEKKDFKGTPQEILRQEIAQATKIRDDVLSFLYEYASYAPPGTEVLLSGTAVLQHDFIHDKSIEKLLQAEVCVVPIVCGIIYYLVRDLRLMLIPPILLVTTVLLSSAIIWQLTFVLPVYTNDIPPSMVSVAIALSMDFSLFFLTRFKENDRAGIPLDENIRILNAYTAQTVASSGLLVCIAFFGAVLIPEGNLQAAGISLAVTSLVCVVVSVIMYPAILFYGGDFFSRPILGECQNGESSRNLTTPYKPVSTEMKMDPGSHRDDVSNGTGASQQDLLAHESRETRYSEEESGFWYSLMKRVERSPVTAAFLVFLVFLPLMLQVRRIRTSADAFEMLPETLPSIQAMHFIQSKGFPLGRFEPYTLVISYRGPHEIDRTALSLPSGMKSCMLTPDAFEAMAQLDRRVSRVGQIAGRIGPVQMMNASIDYEQARSLIRNLAPPRMHKLRSLYMLMLRIQASPQFVAMQLHTTFAPEGVGAADWVMSVREAIAEWERDYPDMEATLFGGAAENADVRTVVWETMPIYLGAVICVVMVLVLLLFRSVILSLQLALALVFTLPATFGFAVFVYQTEFFWGIMPWLKLHNGLAYESVPVAVCIGIALGLDYDIFLISRIVEYRKEGFTDRDSIVKGVAKTGGIISGAGLIMSLAFSGLLFSSKVMHQQFATLLIASVMLDTFVVRTVLVPALMLVCGSWNWWPYKMPEPTKISDENGLASFERLPEDAERGPRDYCPMEPTLRKSSF